MPVSKPESTACLPAPQSHACFSHASLSAPENCPGALSDDLVGTHICAPGSPDIDMFLVTETLCNCRLDLSSTEGVHT